MLNRIQFMKMRLRLFKLFNIHPSWMRYVSVEPALIFFSFSHVMSEFLNTNLFLQKSCRNDPTIEPDLSTFCDNEKRGITYVSWINSNFGFIKMTLTVLCTMLLTSWSDEAGKRRRPLILLPIIGQIFESLSGCLHSYFWYWPPIYAISSNLVFHILSGGLPLFGIACFIYICEVSTFESRTMRIGIVSAIKIVCVPISNGFAGFILRHIGFFYCYGLSLLFSLTSLLYAIVFIEDISVPVSKKPAFRDIFNPSKLIENFAIVFKPSLGRKRIIVALLLLIQIFVVFSTEGEKSIFYLYFRYRFKWDERTYSYYIAYKLIGVILGTIFCSVILSKIYKIHDGVIGILAGFWDTVAVICYYFADKTWQLYLIPFLDIFHGAARDAYASFLSKFYEAHEFGRLCSVVMTFGLIIPSCQLLYNTVFQNTMDSAPSSFFLISCVVDTIVCILYGWAYVLSKRFINHSTAIQPN